MIEGQRRDVASRYWTQARSKRVGKKSLVLEDHGVDEVVAIAVATNGVVRS